MFVGHAALALAAKKRVPEVNLGWLVAASFGLDLIWPLLLLAGIEHARGEAGITAFNALDLESYPWSHSLLLTLVWGGIALGLARWRKASREAAIWIGALVVSHWVLDWITHIPDLPMWPGGPKVGLGLWNSVAGTYVVEGGMYAIGIAIYLRATRARDRIGTWALWGFLLTCAVMWASSPFGPPPPSDRTLGAFSLVAYLLVLWIGWADRHREPAGWP